MTNGVTRPVTLSKIVSAYIKWYQPTAKAELDFYANLSSLLETIEYASRAKRPDGKRHDHQRRINKKAIEQVVNSLTPSAVSNAQTFDELYNRVSQVISPIWGIGSLMIYDTALRIGAQLGREPEKVYLHAGTREGAKALGLDARKDYINTSELPAPFLRLRPHEIEDCLCIYKKFFRKIGA